MAPRKKKSKRKNEYKEHDEERETIKKKLNAKYGRKPESKQEAVVNPKTCKIHNPSSFVIEKSCEAHLNKINNASKPEYIAPSQWLCALCGQQSCRNDLGDLFGPYYVNNVTLPKYLKEAEEKPEDEFDYLPYGEHWNYDIWLHGHCAVWSDNLVFVGGKLLELSQHMDFYWKQVCMECHQVGASVSVEDTNGYVHYYCGKQNNYLFDDLLFKCYLKP